MFRFSFRNLYLFLFCLLISLIFVGEGNYIFAEELLVINEKNYSRAFEIDHSINHQLNLGLLDREVQEKDNHIFFPFYKENKILFRIVYLPKKERPISFFLDQKERIQTFLFTCQMIPPPQGKTTNF